MPHALDVLVIDDDPISQKVIRKALGGQGLELHVAIDGETGLEQAFEKTPDIIILDVEMPGMTGYEVCEQLRQDPLTVDTPIIFLSSHADLRSRMQGYEVGGNDYLVKPFEQEDLLAKIRVLAKYSENKRELRQQYDIAQQTAFSAMTTSSELGEVMLFVERSYEMHSYEDLARALFNVTDKLSINCLLMVIHGTDNMWFSSDGSISPLEQELVEMSDRNQRFVDFGQRTIVHFSYISLLVRNMPLDEPERYGRIKDLLPILLAVVNAKSGTLATEAALKQQTEDLLKAFTKIKNQIFHFTKKVMSNQDQSEEILREMINNLTMDFLRLGLDEDQEQYIIRQIDSSIHEAMNNLDASDMLYSTLRLILNNLNEVVGQQEVLVETFETLSAKKEEEAPAFESDDDGIELF